MYTVAAALLVALAIAPSQGRADELLANGSFQTGNFTDWTIFTTSNGSLGSGLPVVTSFNVTGSGTTNAAKFEVGEVSFTGADEGGGVYQDFTTSGGSTTLSYAFAATGDGTHVNADGGLFELLLNNTVLASFDTGMIGPTQIDRGTLSDTLTLAPGTYKFEILMERDFLNGPGNTPYQYVTDATVLGAAVAPEPSSLLLVITGLLGIAGDLKRKLI